MAFILQKFVTFITQKEEKGVFIMIKITVGNNVKRETVIIDSATTLREVLENSGISYETSVLHLDGASLRPGDLDKTFEDFGITEKAFLLAVQKADNA